MTDILDAVRRAARKRLLYLPHAISQMARPANMISANEVERVVTEGEYLAVITAYVPDPSQWFEEGALVQCLHCKGRMQRGVAGFSVDRKGYHVHWDAIPAWVCTQCGEPLFEAREVDLIQRALVALDRENQNLIAAS